MLWLLTFKSVESCFEKKKKTVYIIRVYLHEEPQMYSHDGILSVLTTADKTNKHSEYVFE